MLDSLDPIQVDSAYPTSMIVPAGRMVEVPAGDSAYGVVGSGVATVEVSGARFELTTGMYFSAPGPARILNLIGFVCVRHGYVAPTNVGGPIEVRGRLRYIDGCSDTLLISPPLIGDPCLSFLFAPPGTRQTAHTHPSVRVGIVVSGNGECHWGEGSVSTLKPGTIFILPTNRVHHFETADDLLRIVVYHPDSNFGPTHDNHPMINRTEIDGQSVAGNRLYQTKELGGF